MREPGQNLCHSAQNGAFRHLGSVDHDDRQAKVACGSQLGRGPGPTGILGHDMGDPMLTHQRRICIDVKRPAGNFDGGIGQRQRGLGRIDEAQQIVMLGLARKRGEVLFANRQKHPCAVLRQRLHSLFNTAHVNPDIPRPRLPGRPFKGAERHPSRPAGQHGMGAHLRGKRMGGIDHMSDLFGRKIALQTINAAKAADPHRQGLPHWLGRASRIGKDRILSALCQDTGQLRRLSCAAQKKDACHV